MPPDDRIFEEGFALRDAYWRKRGEVEPDLIAPTINPSLQGGARWPNMRQAWRVVRSAGETFVVSEGLSDPYDDDEEQPPGRSGLGIEVFAHTTDGLKETAGSWLFQLVYEASQFVAGHGGVAELMEDMGVLASELYNVEAGSTWLNEHGRVGVLLNVVPSWGETVLGLPMGRVRMVSLKLLTQRELQHAVSGGKGARVALARRFVELGEATRSSLLRSSIV